MKPLLVGILVTLLLIAGGVAVLVVQSPAMQPCVQEVYGYDRDQVQLDPSLRWCP
jgi:hypothetical protein